MSMRDSIFTPKLLISFIFTMDLSFSACIAWEVQYADIMCTVLRGCTGIIVRGVHCNTLCQYRLAGTACGAGARGPPQTHDELPRAAAGLLGGLALAHHPPEAFDAAQDTLDQLADGEYNIDEA